MSACLRELNGKFSTSANTDRLIKRVATSRLLQFILPVSLTFETARYFERIGVAMSVETLQDLFIDELKDLYSAEKQIVRALPKLAKAVSTPELQEALLSHLEETKGQM